MVERARGLYPHIRVQVSDALIIKSLRFGRGGRHLVIYRADAFAKRQGALKDLARHIANSRVRGMRVFLGE